MVQNDRTWVVGLGDSGGLDSISALLGTIRASSGGGQASSNLASTEVQEVLVVFEVWGGARMIV